MRQDWADKNQELADTTSLCNPQNWLVDLKIPQSASNLLAVEKPNSFH
jgi:hypothetical protein